MSVKRIAALGAMAATAMAVGSGVATASEHASEQPQQGQSQPDQVQPSVEGPTIAFPITVEFPIGFADTGAKQIMPMGPAAEQEDAPGVQFGNADSDRSTGSVSQSTTTESKPEPRPLPDPQPKPQDPNFPSPVQMPGIPMPAQGASPLGAAGGLAQQAPAAGGLTGGLLGGLPLLGR